jgi:hypothetical protein
VIYPGGVALDTTSPFNSFSDEIWLPEWSAGLITLKLIPGQHGMETAKFCHGYAHEGSLQINAVPLFVPLLCSSRKTQSGNKKVNLVQ